MTAADAEFQEASAHRRIEAEPLSHLSVELGHFYHRDLASSFDFFAGHYRRISRWAATARADWAERLAGRRPRISTCVLIDDYFQTPARPAELVPKLVRAARSAGLEIDYVARESGCADRTTGPGRWSPAELVEARLVEDPPPGTTGARPPATQTGWLCNGRRSPTAHQPAAMKAPVPWRPPAENAAINHSIFVDIQLWDRETGDRRWSCAMLAAAWQLLRLGMLRDRGARAVVPQPLPDPLPDAWDRLPALIQVNPAADPFTAYRTLSIVAPPLLPTEHAVRTILEQVAVDPDVRSQIEARERGETIDPPAELVNRIGYLFVDTGVVRGAGSG
ncbi:MAG: hypothetical protein HKP61_13695 [Dactylosporangium sp.]|nr:hypothetical protein [Dactylosporangium sp.]NNJ61967.1 hypothetical protein [Dactylosporangium sp.]